MAKAELSEGTFQTLKYPAAAGPAQHSPVTSFEDFGTRLEPSTSGSLKSSFLPLLLLPSSLSSTLFFSSCRLAATDALTAAATSLSSSSLQDRSDSLGQTARIKEQLPGCSLTSVVPAPVTSLISCCHLLRGPNQAPPLQSTPARQHLPPRFLSSTCRNNNPGQKKPG